MGVEFLAIPAVPSIMWFLWNLPLWCRRWLAFRRDLRSYRAGL